MRVPELKSLAREHRLRGYSRMRKAALVALLQNSLPPGQSRASTSPPPPTQTWEPIDDRRPRKPSPQEMDIFEQQEMNKSRPQVKGKLNKWYDWLINHVPKPIKDGQGRSGTCKNCVTCVSQFVDTKANPGLEKSREFVTHLIIF